MESVVLELSLVPPVAIGFGGRHHRVGGTCYRGLRCLLAGGSVGVSLAAFCTAVWGETVQRPVTIRAAIWRLNVTLTRIGCSRRVLLDGDRVMLDGTTETEKLSV